MFVSDNKNPGFLSIFEKVLDTKPGREIFRDVKGAVVNILVIGFILFLVYSIFRFRSWLSEGS